MRMAHHLLATVCVALTLALCAGAQAQGAGTPPAASDELAAPSPDDAPGDAGASGDTATTDAGETGDADADAGQTGDADANAGETGSAALQLQEPSGPPIAPPGYGNPQPYANYAAPTVYGPATATGQEIPHYVPPSGPVPIRPPPPETLRNVITVDPIAAIQGLIILTYHRALGDRVSFYLGPEVLIPGVIVDGVKGGGVILGLGIHLLRPAPTGLWFGPRFEILFLTDGIDRGVGILAGAMAGYSWQWGHFTLSLGAGASYAHFEINGYSVLDRIIPMGRTALGFAF